MDIQNELKKIDVKFLINRAINLLKSPQTTLEEIKSESYTTKELLVGVFLLPYAIVVVCNFINTYIWTRAASKVSNNLLQYTDKLKDMGIPLDLPQQASFDIGYVVKVAIVNAIVIFLSVYIFSYVTNFVSKLDYFKTEISQTNAFKLIVFLFLLSAISSIVSIIPILGIIVSMVIGIYSLYILYLGIKSFSNSDKAIQLTIACILCTVIVGAVLSLILNAILV